MQTFLIFPRWTLLSLIVFLSCQTESSSKFQQTQVLVIGGGASGVAAGIQAARSGMEVILVEEGPWLGGMLTAAGVSATDGNHRLPSGLWGEFRQKIYDHYGGPDSVFTGWVSNTQFEPSIGNQIWNELADAELQLKRIHGFRVVKVYTENATVTGASFINITGDSLHIQANITIEATELGDALALAGCEYRTGIDSRQNPHDDRIQDLTYTAILQDYGPGKDMTIPQPPDYDPAEYECICKEVCEDPQVRDTVVNCQQVMTYALLPNRKYLLNWPRSGNDYFVNPIPLSHEERLAAYEQAKNKTLGLVYFLQTEAGYSQWSLAENEFPTEDDFPLMPYHREARRVKGMIQLRVADLEDPYANPARPWYQQAVAVGDYPLDLHHLEKNPVPEHEFPPIPSFSIPYGALVPQRVDGLLVGEKSISVSHRVNGATRLQPCVITIGQAAGAAAAICVQQQLQPSQIPIPELQQTLLEAKCWLLPYLDVPPQDPDFLSIQRVGLTGLMRGTGIPYQWANQTWFYPDSMVLYEELLQAFEQAGTTAPEAYRSLAPEENSLPRRQIARILDSLVLPLADFSLDLEYVFRSGDHGYQCFRIPAIVKASNGDLLAFAEGRKNGCSDTGSIDLVMKRSTDAGKTWGDLEVIWNDGENTCGNPAPIVDRETGDMVLLSTWNLGSDHEREIIAQTSADTRRIFVLRSSDHGHTWSEAEEITEAVKLPAWTWYATGPGSGIQLTQGPHAGRLIVGCDHIEAETKHYYSHSIYSDDHGLTWNLGGTTPQHQVNECEIAELSDGRLMINMRNYDRNQKTRQVAFSADGGLTWEKQQFDAALIEPICQASLQNLTHKGKHILLFSNPASQRGRVNMTVRMSRNDGASWKVIKQLHTGPSAYSDLVKVGEEKMGCLYECGFESPYEGIRFEGFAIR